ncbi:tetratricopeptide repeat protein [Bremerella sp. P1]|uniref:tetratricopeptide repeat protein n=1 Tax=Bremerella sp. P1 TaxID=3026424 RepID=UPI0023681BE2|nr:tetratricopeptide repeat protein [Bremerella sp. P1]WDI42851.1 tetratricopeptide repeat protein [Bremerella sp. P1]
MKSLVICLLGLWGTALLVGSSAAQDYKVGDKVVVTANASLQLSGEEVGSVSLGDVLQVKAINDKWLWVKEDEKGWLNQQYVVPLNRAAIEQFTKLVKENPKNAGVYIKRGNVWLNLNEIEPAIADFSEAIRLEPKMSLAYNNRGTALFNKGDHDRAIEDYSKAIELDPKEKLAYFNRGNVWLEKGEFDKALENYNEAIELDPKMSQAYCNRGIAWHSKGEYDKEIEDYNEAIRLEPKLSLAYVNRGYAWSDKREYDRAIKDYNESIRLDPNTADGYNELAWLLATCPSSEHRDGELAIRHATKACELTNWKNDSYIDTLSAAHATEGDFKKAIEYLDQAIELNPDTDPETRNAMRSAFNEGKPYLDEDS